MKYVIEMYDHICGVEADWKNPDSSVLVFNEETGTWGFSGYYVHNFTGPEDALFWAVERILCGSGNGITEYFSTLTEPEVEEINEEIKKLVTQVNTIENQVQ